MFRSETLFFKSWVKEGIVMIKNLKLRDGVAGDLIKCSIVCECLCVWNVHCE